MANVNFSSLIADKINELKSTIATTKTDAALTKNTRGTKLYKLGRDRRVLHLIDSLVTQLGDKVKLTPEDMDTFVLITTLEGERADRSSVVVAEGDSILELMQRYEDKKDLAAKLNKAAEKAGLKLDFTSGKVVKA